MTDLPDKYRTGLILLLIISVAVFFRFYKITEIPPGLYPDEATNGVNALDAIHNTNFSAKGGPALGWKVFYPENNGREGLFINIQALSLKIFGVHPWALRGVAGVFGVLTVLGVFFFTKLFWSPRVALLASYLIAVSFWPVNFARIGFRANLLPLVLVWSFYFLWLGIIKKKFWPISIAGLVYGIGFHSYISWRASPLILLAIFAVLWFVKNADRKFLAKSALVFLAGAIIVASPLLWHYLKNPPDFVGRAAQVSIFNSSEPVKSLGLSVLKTLGMFNVYGDGNWRHNLAGRPELFWPLGIGFLIGLVVSLWSIKETRHNFLIISWLVMLLPNFLAPEGAPHALRALGAMPAVFILSAVGLEAIYEKTQRYFNRLLLLPQYDRWFGQILRIKRELGVLALSILLLVGIWEARVYFVVWANATQTHFAFDERLVDIGNYLKSLNGDIKKYVLVNEDGVLINGIPIQSQTIIFLNYPASDIKFLRPQEINKLPPDLPNAVIIPTFIDSETINQLALKYPQGRLADFITFKVLKLP